MVGLSFSQIPVPSGPSSSPRFSVSRSVTASCQEKRRSLSQSCMATRSSSAVNNVKKPHMPPPSTFEDPLMKLYGFRTPQELIQKCPPSCKHGQEKEEGSLMTHNEFKRAPKEVYNSDVSCAKEMQRKDVEEDATRLIKSKTFSNISKLCFLLLLSGFLAAAGFAFFEQYYLNHRAFNVIVQSTEVAASDVVPGTGMTMLQVENYMQSVAEELRSIREEIHRNKETAGVACVVETSPSRDILEELFTRQPDLACAGNLGSVLATPDTVTFSTLSYLDLMGLFSWDLVWPHRPPATVIKGLIQEVGDCWPFTGERGRLVLALHRPSLVTAVSLSHVPTTITPSGNIATAPKTFIIVAHKSEDDFTNGLLLGHFEYNSIGPWRQTFTIDPEVIKEELFRIIEFQFLNNQGNPDYTCIYRVHVHGIMH